MDFKLTGKSALVTGASQGIGRATAIALAEQGVDLHLTARSADNLQSVRDQILNEGNVGVEIHPLDLSEIGACSKLVDAVGRVDILINNAGAIPAGDLTEVDEIAWRRGGTESVGVHQFMPADLS